MEYLFFLSQSSFSNRFGHFFDLTSSIGPSRLAAVDTATFDATQQEPRSVVWSGYNILCDSQQAVVVAEWLRRWTRNPLGSARAGSNPADYVFFSSTTN